MASAEETRPLVVLAQKQGMSASFAQRVEEALQEDGREFRRVSSLEELTDCLRESRCLCVFLSHDFVPNPIQLIRSARQATAVEWFLMAPSTSRRLIYRAVEAGVKGVLDEFMTPFQYAQRTRQVWASVTAEEREALLHKDVRPSGVSRATPVVEEIVPETPRDPLAGLELVTARADYRVRRPDWEQVEQSIQMRPFSGLEKFRSECELDLLGLIAEEKRVSVGLLSLRVKDPLEEMPPRRVKSLVSSNILEKHETTPVEFYPELLSALEFHKATLVPDFLANSRFEKLGGSLYSQGVRSRAAIPLYMGETIVGMMKVQFPDPINERYRNLLEDLVSFSPAFVDSFAKMDFLERIYEGMAL